MEAPQAVLDQVSGELQAYVYMLVDPEPGVPFYVGKGHGLRHAAYVAEALVPVAEAGEELAEACEDRRGPGQRA